MPDDPNSTARCRSETSPALDSTIELIQQVRRGDQEALDRLLTRHVDPFAGG
jgi:hypothetical protein